MESPLSNIGRPAELNIRQFGSILLRRKWIIIASVILVVGVVMFYTIFLTIPQYQSSADILQRHSGLDKALLGSELFSQDVYQPERDLETAASLVTSPEVVSAVNTNMADRLNGKSAVSMISVNVSKNTNILNIIATDPDPQLASDVANAFALEYVNWRQKVDRTIIQQARTPIEAQVLATPPEQQDSVSFKVLKDKLETLRVVESMQTGDFEIVRPASPASAPVSPNPPQAGIMALLASLVIGVAAVFLVEHVDNRIHDVDEIKKQTSQPVLAAIPTQPSSLNGSLASIEAPAGAVAEAYRLLKTNLAYARPDEEIKSIMTTSASPSEGKSTVIANLAVTLARAGKRVIILELDMRRPSMARYFGLDDSVGVTNAISGTHQLREVLQMIEPQYLVTEGFESGDSENRSKLIMDNVKPIYCATCGPLPPNPGELAASDKLKSLISEASGYADVVLVDAPPMGSVGDAASIASRMDGLIFVVRLSDSSRKSIDMIQNFIDVVPCNPMGIVATNVKASGGYYYNGYGYYGSYK